MRSCSLKKSVDQALNSATMFGSGMGNLIYEETCDILKIFLKNVIPNTVTYTAMGIVYTLKRKGRTYIFCG
ncbi:hypothetical protein ZIOFF_063408 [Zingiber officinale]|uniref:Uncharacterized protein n=1 Tax=Zingiber officinale TaxID=94328 RepID=A0A8J5F1K6_ZINOF|nr:hypothetical protein ZIOFF_063408 [Zingiber officinale]